MMNWLVSISLRHRVVVAVLAAVLIVVGVRASRTMPFDVFPEFAPTLVEIQTEAPGLSTEEVESLVSVPIESVVNGISFLETVRSKSVLGLSSVVLIFERGTDLWQARQVVQERLTTLSGRLPEVASPPVMVPPLSATSRVLKVGLTSEKLSQMELTTLVVWTMRPRLMAVPGVANVAIWGQKDRQLQALVDPERLRAHGLTLESLVESLRSAPFCRCRWFCRHSESAAGDPAPTSRRERGRSRPTTDRLSRWIGARAGGRRRCRRGFRATDRGCGDQ